MKSRILASLTAISLLALTLPMINAQNQSQSNRAPYFFVTLGTLGGTVNSPNSINDIGWITGGADLAGDNDEHAALWLYGSVHDLGTLGGPNSAVLWPVHNQTGLIAGVSDTTISDPLGEVWSCGAFLPASHVGHTCVGFLWQNGIMTGLPTLGGNNGFATGVNDSGVTVGWAETTYHDPTCIAPQVLQFLPVTYGPKQGQIHTLPTLSGDSDGAATAINDKGQIVGISGACGTAVGGPSAAHAVLWQNGAAQQLGTLGGSANNTPMIISQNGWIAGFSDLPGDENGASPNFHAALWTKTDGSAPLDLGTLPGDYFSEATGINNRQQIVGESCNSSFTLCTAVLWQNGNMIDLNSVAPHGSLYLFYANDINSSGQITGVALNQQTGELVGYLAIPTSGLTEVNVPQSKMSVALRVPLPAGVSQQMMKKFGLLKSGQ